MSVRTWRWLDAAWRFGPPLLWMGIMSGFSTDAFSPEHTGGYLLPFLRWLLPSATPAVLELLNVGVRKATHMMEYGVLALLWYRALRPPEADWPTRAGLIAFLLSAAFGGVDEFHQTFVPSRTGSLVDVGWDCLGAGLALITYAVYRRVPGKSVGLGVRG